MQKRYPLMVQKYEQLGSEYRVHCILLQFLVNLKLFQDKHFFKK